MMTTIDRIMAGADPACQDSINPFRESIGISPQGDELASASTLPSDNLGSQRSASKIGDGDKFFDESMPTIWHQYLLSLRDYDALQTETILRLLANVKPCRKYNGAEESANTLAVPDTLAMRALLQLFVEGRVLIPW